MTKRQARIRKPRPPHRARRVHGPAAAFAGYKNSASSIAYSFPSFPNRPTTLLFCNAGPASSNPARASLSELIPSSGSPDRPRRSGDSCVEQDPPIGPPHFAATDPLQRR